MKDRFRFWKNLVLLTLFFTMTPLALGVSLFSLFSFSKSPQNPTISPVNGLKVYASLPSIFPSVSGAAQGADARAEIIRQYLQKYGSPLTAFADLIVEAADEYKIDFRLTTAIAQQESNLCKVIPPKTYNCWGWGIHSQGTLGFSSYEEGVKEVTRGLAEDYISQGYDTPEKIMKKYTPLSNGSWAGGISEFLSEME